MDYTIIDHLLLNVNKGPGANNPAGPANPGPARPGDSVMVSMGDRGLVHVLIHRANQEHQTLMGETTGAIRDEEGREIIGEGSPVCFSYKKIAGIHRR